MTSSKRSPGWPGRRVSGDLRRRRSAGQTNSRVSDSRARRTDSASSIAPPVAYAQHLEARRRRLRRSTSRRAMGLSARGGRRRRRARNHRRRSRRRPARQHAAPDLLCSARWDCRRRVTCTCRSCSMQRARSCRSKPERIALDSSAAIAGTASAPRSISGCGTSRRRVGRRVS